MEQDPTQEKAKLALTKTIESYKTSMTDADAAFRNISDNDYNTANFEFKPTYRHYTARVDYKTKLQNNILLFLKNGLDVNTQYEQSKTGAKKTIEVLLAQENIDVNIRDKNNNTPLGIIIKNITEPTKLISENYSQVHIVEEEKLLMDEYDVPFTSEEEMLIEEYEDKQISNRNYAKLIELFLKHGLDINTTYSNSKTLLHYAVEDQNFELAELLMGHRDIKDQIKDDNGQTAKNYTEAENYHNKEIIYLFNPPPGKKPVHSPIASPKAENKILSEEKPQTVLKQTPNLQSNEKSHSKIAADIPQLKDAVVEDKVDIVKRFIQTNKNKFNINEDINESGDKLIHLATSEDMIKELLKAKADINSTNEYGATVLHTAVLTNDHNLIKSLISNEADVNCKDGLNMSPLHLAVSKNQRDNVSTLLESEADPNSSGFVGNTPLYIASQKGDLEILKLLVEKNGKIDQCNDNNSTLLHSATIGISKGNDSWAIVEYLLTLYKTNNQLDYPFEKNKLDKDSVDILCDYDLTTAQEYASMLKGLGYLSEEESEEL